MSIMVCDRCDRYIDTDWDVEGVFTPDGQFVCSFCVEDDAIRAAAIEGARSHTTAPLPGVRRVQACHPCEGSGYMGAPRGAEKSVCLMCGGEGVTG